MKYILYILTVLFSLNASSQNAKQHIREGNKQYSEKKYEAANASYKKALEKDSKSAKADFNLGDALYKQKKYAEAIEQFQKFADKTDDKKARIAAAVAKAKTKAKAKAKKEHEKQEGLLRVASSEEKTSFKPSNEESE